VLGPILLKLNDAATVYVPIAQVAPGLRTGVAALVDTATLQGPQSLQDKGSYRVWHKTELAGGPAGKILVDDAGKAVYLRRPGHQRQPHDAPRRHASAQVRRAQAVLMSLHHQGHSRPAASVGAVIFGVIIALVLEMAKVPSLPFAVGVVLPLSSSAPIFVGGMLRWLVDHRRNNRRRMPMRCEEERTAAGRPQSGRAARSGYIAGGALAGILIAFTAGVLGVSTRPHRLVGRPQSVLRRRPFRPALHAAVRRPHRAAVLDGKGKAGTLMRVRFLPAALAIPCAAIAAEGMWPLDNLPASRLKAEYSFTPSRIGSITWMHASARIAGGCSASFVSKDGLVMTNHLVPQRA